MYEIIFFDLSSLNRIVHREGHQITTTLGACGISGYIDGQRNVSRLSRPTACLVDGDSLLIADDGNKVIRRFNLVTKVEKEQSDIFTYFISSWQLAGLLAIMCNFLEHLGCTSL